MIGKARQKVEVHCIGAAIGDGGLVEVRDHGGHPAAARRPGKQQQQAEAGGQQRLAERAGGASIPEPRDGEHRAPGGQRDRRGRRFHQHRGGGERRRQEVVPPPQRLAVLGQQGDRPQEKDEREEVRPQVVQAPVVVVVRPAAEELPRARADAGADDGKECGQARGGDGERARRAGAHDPVDEDEKQCDGPEPGRERLPDAVAQQEVVEGQDRGPQGSDVVHQVGERGLQVDAEDQVVWRLRVEEVTDPVVVGRPRQVALLGAEVGVGGQHHRGQQAAQKNRPHARPPINGFDRGQPDGLRT